MKAIILTKDFTFYNTSTDIFNSSNQIKKSGKLQKQPTVQYLKITNC